MQSWSRRIARIASAVAMGLPLLSMPLSAVAWGAQSLPVTPQSAPVSTAPAGSQTLSGLITDVVGLAEMRDDEHAAWHDCVKGAVVQEGAEIRTAAHSMVSFAFPLGQQVTVSRLTVVKVLRSKQENTLCIFDLGLKYGRTQYQIDSAGVEYRSTIRSPNSTLAVRGTVVSLYDQGPFPPQAVSLTGRAVYTAANRQVAFGGKNAGRTEVRAGQDAASVALDQSVQDPVTAFARTAQEMPLVTNLLSSGAVFNAPPGGGIPIVSGGVPPSDQQLLSLLPGALNFVLRWGGNADLNLVVGNQAGAGEFLMPVAGLNATPSGGRIRFNDIGGPSGGIEIAFWPHSYPQGIYFAAAQNVSGPAMPFTLDVFQHGQLTPIFDPAGNGGAGQFVNTFSSVSQPGTSVAAFVPVGVPVPPNFGASAASTARSPSPQGPRGRTR